ncbi:unnamed protein product [Closterium sp. Naga37s-1]|nr:unnamed protein product [Closterium sp. Naga37s-1]
MRADQPNRMRGTRCRATECSDPPQPRPSQNQEGHRIAAPPRIIHARIHSTRFLVPLVNVKRELTGSARSFRCTSSSSHRLTAVSAASGASKASGESEPSVSAQIREIGEEEPGLRGRFLQDDVGPNQVVLEAQARVCTGPTQTRPLGEEEMRRVLEQILLSGVPSGVLSAKGELPPSLRSGVSEGERRALVDMWPALRYHLPRDVLFLADPQGAIFNNALPVGPTFLGHGSEQEAQVVGDLRDILFGVHLGFQKTMSLLQNLLPMRGGSLEGGAGAVIDALVAAYLIAVRMNRETDRELKAFCLAFDQAGWCQHIR